MTAPGHHVLVVDDEPAIRRFLRVSLKTQNFRISEAGTGAEALESIRRQSPDLLILDLGLPDRNGLHLIRQLRETGSALPIIVLSSRAEQDMKVAALDLGADDYITKPFGMEELMARLRTALRHRLQQAGQHAIFRDGGLSVDLVARLVKSNDIEIKLSPREFDLLRLLVTHAGKVITHRHIMREVWGGDVDVQYLRTYIRALRQKIEADPERPVHILTEQGVGYRLRGG